MIDLDEFERRLRRPAAAPHPQEDPLAELARLVGGREDPFKTVFEQDRQMPRAPRVAGTPMSFTRAAQPEPLPDLDQDHFDQDRFEQNSFENGAPPLHGTLHPQSYAENPARTAVQASYPSQPVEDNDYVWPEIEAPIAPANAREVNAREADTQRSRRPLFITAAIIFAGIAGIGVSFAYKSKSGPHELAVIKAISGPTKVQPDSPGGTDVPNQDASILDKTPQPTPVGLSDHNEQPVDLALQQGAALPRTMTADASGTMGAASVPGPLPSAGTQTGSLSAQQNIQSYGIGQLIEPKKVKTVSVRSDGTLLPNDTPPQMPSSVAPSAAPLPHAAAPSTAGATPKPATSKSTARVVTTPRPAQSIGQLADDANEAAAPPAAVAKQKPTPAKPLKLASAEAADSPSEVTKTPGGRSFAVQFAAPGSEHEAHEVASKLSQKFGGELDGHHLTYHQAKVGDKTVYRVRTSGLTREEANVICQKVQSNGGSCFVAKD